MEMVWLVLQTSGPGSVVIKDCSGDTIMGNDKSKFWYCVFTQELKQWHMHVLLVPDVYGCMDPDYQEYNPLQQI